MEDLTTSPKDLKIHIAIQMLKSGKSPPKNLQMQRLMLPKVRVNLQNEAASPSQKESTAWITIYASIAANQDIKP
jgi:hypothetical protein